MFGGGNGGMFGGSSPFDFGGMGGGASNIRFSFGGSPFSFGGFDEDQG
jgi:hypothetical protein